MFILFLPRIMYHGLYYFLSIDDETNIHGGNVICPRSQNLKQILGLELFLKFYNVVMIAYCQMGSSVRNTYLSSISTWQICK